MQRLEDVENKREVLEDFFIWLFDDERIIEKSISLDSEIDFSLCAHYSDPNIYFPEQIKSFFETKPMKRLNRISQLGLAINIFPNSYHNRLEHSKGVYNKKVEEFFYKYQDLSWRKYIEDNDLKLYLIAELIKVAGHDIGHLPLSHALEEQIFGERGVHEDIGQRIMLENDEIQKVISDISPELNSKLAELYNNDLFNFKSHDESNYDIDRLDYLIRDSLYLGSSIHLPIQNYETVKVKSDSDNKPIFNIDNTISESDFGNYYIDVYDFSSLPEIEKMLELRLKQYNNVYMLPQVQTFETSIKNFLDAFLETDSEVGQNLKTFLLHLKESKVTDINLDTFIEYDEINFYSELLDIAKCHENSNIRDLATMIIPNMSAFLTLVYSFLNVHSKKQTYSDNDKKFLKKIKSLITSNSDLLTNLNDENYFNSNILFLPEDTPFLDTFEKSLISSYSYTIYSYKKKKPIYIRDKSGNIYELSHHPDRKCDWDNEKSLMHSSYVNIPYLKYNGVSDNLINKLKAFYPNSPLQQPINSQNTNVNMQPLQVGHNIEDAFLDL